MSSGYNRNHTKIIIGIICLCAILVLSLGFSLSQYEKSMVVDELSLNVISDTVVVLKYMDGTTNNAEYIYDGTLPSPNRTGYTFQGWYVGIQNGSEWSYGEVVTGEPENGSVLLAGWTPNADTPYKVVHMTEDLNADTYSTYKTENLTGTTGVSIEPGVLTITGFTAPAKTETTIAADGSTVVTYKYTRNSYKFTLGTHMGVDVTGSSSTGDFEYGATVTLKAAAKTGYTWSKWTSSNTTLQGDLTTANTTFTMPEGAITMTPSATGAYAIYSETDNSLTFYKNATSTTVGSTYQGKKVTAVYTGIEATNYAYNYDNDTSNVPWHSDGTCSSVTSVIFADEIKPISTAAWFCSMGSCTSMDIAKLNTVNVTTMDCMFRACVDLPSLDVSHFNTSNLKDMANMFNWCRSLTSLNVSNFDTSNVTSYWSAFAGCEKLTTLDLSNFETKNAVFMNLMFAECHALKTIYVSENWNISSLSDSVDMFTGCLNLVGCAGSSYSTYGNRNATFAHIDEGTSNPGYLSLATVIPQGGIYYVTPTGSVRGDYSGYVEKYEAGELIPVPAKTGDVYVYGDYEYRYNQKTDRTYTATWTTDTSINGWSARVRSDTQVSYENILSEISTAPVTDHSFTFYGCTNLVSAPNLSSKATRLYYTFDHCSALTTAPSIPNGVVNMDATFAYCSKLQAAPIIPESVSIMTQCFFLCSEMKTVTNVPSGVINLFQTFYDCKALTGTITIDAQNLVITDALQGYDSTGYGFAFSGTKENILLIGKSPYLEDLAATDGYTDLSALDNVRVLYGTYYVGVTSTELGNYTGATAVYNLPQDGYPQTVSAGDVFVTADYEYRYNQFHNLNNWISNQNYGYTKGWAVKVLNPSQSSYEDILYSINGENITNLSSTFAYCSNLKSAPEIPLFVDQLYYTYYSSGIEVSPAIPEGVLLMQGTYQFAAALKQAPILPSSVWYLFDTFAQCYSLTAGPTIPSSVTYMYETFYSCYALETPPDMSNATNVQTMYRAFYDCPGLTGTMVINANITEWEECFLGTTQSILLTGSSNRLSELAATAPNGNVTVLNAASLSLIDQALLPVGVTAGKTISISAMPNMAALTAVADANMPKHSVLYGWLVDSGMAQQIIEPAMLEEVLHSVYDEVPDWPMTLTPLYQTTDPGALLLAYAKQEVGTQESTTDYELTEEGEQKGYTKYGAFYGLPYSDWCAMFIGWDMNEAGLSHLPFSPGCATWVRLAQEAGLYYTSAERIPGPGDVVFIDYTVNGSPDHVALLKSIDLEAGTLTTIEGNYSNSVQEVTRPFDTRILGYMAISNKGIAQTVEVPEAPHIHSYAETVVAPTCTESGYTLYQCSCGDGYTGNETEALGHSFGDWVTVLEATTETEGSKERTCTVCGEKEKEVIPILSSETAEPEANVDTSEITEEVTEASKEATETSDPQTAEPAASEESETQSSPEQEPSDSSVEEALEEISETTETGEESHVHEYTETVVAPTCTESGYTLHQCSCGDSYTDNEIAALGHSFGEWIIVREATAESEGSKERTCIICGKKEMETIMAIVSEETGNTANLENPEETSNTDTTQENTEET